MSKPDTHPVIDHARVTQMLHDARSSFDRARFDEILARAAAMKGLSLEDVAYLLVHDEPEIVAELTSLAIKVKQAIYGRRIVFFAPLYTSSYCQNDCAYCGFHAGSQAHRRRLSLDEVRHETELIVGMGHKRILMVAAEDPALTARDLANQVQAIYSVKTDKGEIRRVNVNVAPTETEQFKILKSSGIGTYQCFQETFHKPTYEKLHRHGPKSVYDYRISVFERAIAAGIDDFGMGILFGLYDYRFEVLALLMHVAYLEKQCGVGPHTISIPRLEPAFDTDLPQTSPWLITDEQLVKITAVLRLAVPYTGIILSTRESPALRTRLLEVGVSQMSAASATNPGGYAEHAERPGDEVVPQFCVQDERSLDEVVRDSMARGYIPSFCTGCYRKARTGKVFQSLAKTEKIGHFCEVNAIITLAEFIYDCASPATRAEGEQKIAELVGRLQDETQRREVESRLAEVKAGKRDLIY